MPTLGLVQLMGIYLIYDAFQSPLMRTFIETRWTFFRVKLVFEFWVWDILVLRSLGPLDSSTSYFPLHPHTSSYLCLLRTSFGMERGGGWIVTFDNEIGDGPLTFILILWDLLLPSTFSNSNLLPSLSYFSQLLHPPTKPPDNSSYFLLKALRWLNNSYIKRFQCYSAQRSFLFGGGGGGGIAIIATSSRSRSLRDLR